MSNSCELTDGIPRVLIIDDEEIVCALLSEWLSTAGYACKTVSSLVEAREWLRKEPVDIITCDLQMGRECGLDLIPEVVSRDPLTQVLIVSGLYDPQIAIQALTSGAADFLIKPIRRETLLDHVSRALEHRRRLIDRRRYTECLERRVQEQTIALRQAHEETVHRLMTATMHRDEETGAHIRRTGLFSEQLALAAGWSQESAGQIRMAAPMHDVGKIAVPDAILRKPGRLTPREYELMQQHTIIGARILAGSSSPVIQMAHEIALCHHEHWNGAGYPNGWAGEAIPMSARIVSIADVYDALTHDRVYRRAIPVPEVKEFMQEHSGTQFDPELLALFFEIHKTIQQIADENPDCLEEDDPFVECLQQWTEPAAATV